jgi:hypothetical protein
VEVIPQVGRNFEFALTVRDNVAVGGQTASDLMTLTATDAAGPFVVFKPKQRLGYKVMNKQLLGMWLVLMRLL